MARSEQISVKRVTVEAVAVVLSILLAFAIDAAWDARNDRASEIASLQSLVAELQANRTVFEAEMARHQALISDAKALFDVSRGAEALPADHRAMWLLHQEALINHTTTDYQAGALNALLASGDLGLLRAQDLKIALAAWPTVVEDALENERMVGRAVQEMLAPYVVETTPACIFTVRPADRSAADYERCRAELTVVLGSDRLEGLLAYRLFLERATVQEFTGLLDSLEDLSEMLRRDLAVR